MGGSDFQTRVFVVDDEPIILETMTAILQSQGFVVRTADNGFAALVTLRQTPPDVIISDLRMPEMSGFELLSVVRRRFPHIPVIAISGEYIAAGMPTGLLSDVVLQKGGYTQQQLSSAQGRITPFSICRCYQKNRGFVSKKSAVWRIQSLSRHVVDCRPLIIPSWFTIPEMHTISNRRHSGRGQITS
jgi:CheY-like chemotaxis protein